MTQSMDYTATLKTKRCKNTGMTEDLIRRLHGRPGARVMAIVELCVDDAHNKHDAPNHVDFTIELLEPFPEEKDEAHLRQLTKSSHQHRVLNSDDEQLAIDTAQDLEPTVEDVIATQRAHAAEEPHEFVPDPEHPENCFTCAAGEPAEVHVTADQLEAVGT